MKYVVFAILLTPIWFPLVRFAASFFASTKRWNRPHYWAYAVAFVWSGGLVSFFWASKVPSGIPYGVALLVGWFVLLAGFVLDMASSESKQSTNENQ